jgi:hypothetical protein
VLQNTWHWSLRTAAAAGHSLFRSHLTPRDELYTHQSQQHCGRRPPIHTRSCAGEPFHSFLARQVSPVFSGRTHLPAKYSRPVERPSNSIRERSLSWPWVRRGDWIPWPLQRWFLPSGSPLPWLDCPNSVPRPRIKRGCNREPKSLAARLTSVVTERGWDPFGCDAHQSTVR